MLKSASPEPKEPDLINIGLPGIGVGARLTLARLIHVKGTAVNLDAVKCSDGFLGIIIVGEGSEGEPSGPAGVTVGDDADLLYLAILFEKVKQGLFFGTPRQVSNKNFQNHSPKIGSVESRDSACAPLYPKWK